MNQAIQSILKARHWQHFLTRPFSLFMASLLNQWYLGEESVACLGIQRDERLFIEEKQNVMRYYVPKERMERSLQAVQQKLQDVQTTKKLLEQAVMFNKQAEEVLRGKRKIKELEEAVALLGKVAVYGTAFPYAILEVAGQNTDRAIIRRAEKLRVITYYPRLNQELILPLAKKQLMALGAEPEAVSLLTYQELLHEATEFVTKRQKARKQGKRFVYARLNGKEEIFLTDDTVELIALLEPQVPETDMVKGTPAFPGTVQGTVRLIDIHNWNKKTFHEGDILVSINSSPTYMPLIKKCGALVTDEGGMACHAAIVSRELKKPCIMGTKIATQVLKDGDFIEVDADNGIVRKL